MARPRFARFASLLSGAGVVVFSVTAALVPTVLQPITASAFTAPSVVSDVNPNSLTAGTLFGGRVVAFAVNPVNTQIIFAASEFGGLWKSADHGATWAHVDGLPLTAMQDVQYAPSDLNLMIATGAYDGSIDNRGGGIWRSTDGGGTWAKAPGSDVCGNLAQNNGKKVAIAPGTPGSETVLVGMDCGIARSTNSGGAWSLVSPPGNFQIWDVKVRQVGGNLQVDACGDGGYVRSNDGGSTWPTETDWTAATFPHPSLGSPPTPRNPSDPCRVATAPPDANTVFMATRSPVANPGDKIGETYQFESDDGGVTWHDLQVSQDGNGRDPSAITYPAFDGVATHFEVYFMTDQVTMHQTCDTANTPRCGDGIEANTATCGAPAADGAWAQSDSGIPHCAQDPGDLAYDPNTRCPILEGGDGGIFATADGCDTTPVWTDANTGLHALWLYQAAGSAVPAGSPLNPAPHTDVYYGMQDNGQVCSNDDAATFHNCGGADVFNTIAPRSGPPVTVLKNQDGGFNLYGEDGTTGQPWTSPPVPAGGGIDAVDGFGATSFAFITHDGSKPPVYTVQVTTNSGSSWAQMGPTLPGGPSGLPNGEQPIKFSGTSAAPVFYLELTVAGTPTIYRLQGPLNTTATLTSASAGLANPWTYNVDPANPLRLYAVDRGAGGTARFSTDGGQTWGTDPALKTITTMGAVYPFISAFGPNVNSFGFDPASNTVLAGTQFSGIYASTDGGGHWTYLPGSQQIPRVLNFFFDTRNPGTVYVGSQGRGLWKIHLPQADLSITKTHTPDPVIAGTQLTWTITVTNNGPDPAPAVVVTDTLPAPLTYLTNNLNPPSGCSAAGQTVTCTLGDMDVGSSVSFNLVTFVSPSLVSSVGGPTAVTNTATVASGAVLDPQSNNNTAVDTALVNDSADLGVTKVCKPDTTVIYPNQPVACTVYVDNYGPSYARNVVLDDVTLSNGSFTVTGVAVTPGPTSCTQNVVTGGIDLRCSVGNLANASTTQTGRVTITYTLTATGTSANGQSIDNTASVRSDTPDPVSGNNQATVSLSVTALANLALSKQAAPNPVVAGNAITWTLSVHNAGPSDAGNTVITDTVPAGVTITSVSMPGATCVSGVAGDPVQPSVCSLGTLATGATSSTMTIVATVNPRTTGSLINNARVSSSTLDGDLSDNLASTTTAVSVVSSLAVAVAATPNPVTAGTPLSYQITVSNGGPSTARNVAISDPLPAGLNFTSTGGVGSCGFQTNTSTVTCTLPDLDPGQSEVVFVYTMVRSSTLPQIITNTVTGTATGSPAATGSAPTQVVTSADLGIVLGSDATVYKASSTIHYNITVTNSGPSDAQHVVIVDNLPAVKQGKYISNSLGCPPPVGTTLTCSWTAVAALVTIPTGGSITFQVNFYITGNKQTITSSATVSSATSDPNTANNSSTRFVTVK